MVVLYLMRHGESEFSRAMSRGSLVCNMDTDLTDEGRVQVDTRARAVCAMPYVRMELQGAQVLSSPRRRARQTEQAFREVARLGPAVVSEALDEIWPWEYGVERATTPHSTGPSRG